LIALLSFTVLTEYVSTYCLPIFLETFGITTIWKARASSKLPMLAVLGFHGLATYETVF